MKLSFFLIAFLIASPLHARIGVKPSNRVLLTCGISTANYLEQISNYPFSEEVIVAGEKQTAPIKQFRSETYDAIKLYGISSMDSQSILGPIKLNNINKSSQFKTDGELSWRFENMAAAIAGEQPTDTGNLSASLVFDDYSKWCVFCDSKSKTTIDTLYFSKDEFSKIRTAAYRNAKAQNDKDPKTVGKRATILKMSGIFYLGNNYGYGRLVCALWANENSDEGIPMFSEIEPPSINNFVKAN